MIIVINSLFNEVNSFNIHNNFLRKVCVIRLHSLLRGFGNDQSEGQNKYEV